MSRLLQAALTHTQAARWEVDTYRPTRILPYLPFVELCVLARSLLRSAGGCAVPSLQLKRCRKPDADGKGWRPTAWVAWGLEALPKQHAAVHCFEHGKGSETTLLPSCPPTAVTFTFASHSIMLSIMLDTGCSDAAAVPPLFCSSATMLIYPVQSGTLNAACLHRKRAQLLAVAASFRACCAAVADCLEANRPICGALQVGCCMP